MDSWPRVGFASLAVATAMIAGCGGADVPAPTAGPPPRVVVAEPPPEPFAPTDIPADATEYFRAFAEDILPLAFPESTVSPGPASTKYCVKTKDTLRIEQAGVRRCTTADAGAMLRKLYAKLQALAREKGCDVNPIQPPPEATTPKEFSFAYSLGTRRGTVSALLKPRGDDQPGDSPRDFDVKVKVSETRDEPSQ